MIVRVSRPRGVTAVFLAMALAQLVGGAHVIAAEPPVPGLLDRPIADLALVDVGPAVPPLLMTVDTVDLPVGTARVSLLRRARAWEPISLETVFLSQPWDGAETPWLIELGPGSFAIVSTSHERVRTVLLPVRIASPDTAPRLEPGRPTLLDVAVDDAGATDVDGDGAIELVVSAATTRRGGDVCQGSVVRVLDGSSFSQRAEWAVPDMRLAGGVFGEWDGRPGNDLLAYTYGNCPAGPDSAQRLGVYALRLADGLPIVALSPEDPAQSGASPGVPLAADLDADGRDEVVIRDGARLVVLEPARGWSGTEIARGDVMPLVATAPEAPGGAGTLVWIEHTAPNDNLVIVMGKVGRSPDGSFTVTATTLDLAAVAPARRARVLHALRNVAVAQAPPQAWVGDIDGDGCREIIAPLLTAGCTADVDAADVDTRMKVGATWFATRPIAAFEAGDSRELLIAATMDWNPGDGGPLPATPAAVVSAGVWRHGPSPRFALSEVRAADAAYFSLFPVPRPTIERAAVQGRATDFPGFTGARVLLRVSAAQPDDPPPPDPPSLDVFLSEPVAAGEHVAVERIPVSPGAESGRDGSFVHVSLADVREATGGPAERWTVTIAQVNEWGEIAGPVRGTIVSDVSGPSLTLEAPFLSVPWPLEATVHGRSEPNVEIRGGTGGPVTTDRRGRFELRTQLMPWPQALELTAVDESGNGTTMQFSLVGGIDYRAFPWPAILAITLLLGAVVSAGRGTQSVRAVRSTTENEPLAEIEELPSVRGSPRA